MNIKQFKEKALERYADTFNSFIVKDTARLINKGNVHRQSLDTANKIANYQKELRERFVKALGGTELQVKCSSPIVTGIIEQAEYTIEKVLFQSAPFNYVTANLYKPKTGLERYPVVLFVCGHFAEAKAHPEYQAVIQELVYAGLAVMAIDSIGQGERLNYYNAETGKADIRACTAEHSYNGARAWLTGRPLNYYFVRDILCAIDYLSGRADIDADRIGLTGNSGGGTQTAFIMLLQDERIKAFAPTTYITDYTSQLNTWSPSDDEQILWGMLEHGFNYQDIIISVAPRPVIIQTASHDFFPYDGAIKVYQEAKEIYRLLGAENSLELVVDNAYHKYTRPLAVSAAKFFTKHLAGKRLAESDYKPYAIIPTEALNVTSSGQIITEYTDSRFVWDEVKELAKRQLDAINNNKTAKHQAISFLKEKVFFDREYMERELSFVSSLDVLGYEAEAYEYESTHNLKNLAIVYSKGGSCVSKIRICFFDFGNEYVFDANCRVNTSFLESNITNDTAVAVVDLSNYGLLKSKNHRRDGNDIPHYEMFGYMYNVAHQMFFRGDSIAALKIFEIITAIRNIKNHFSHCEIEVFAEGRIEFLVAAALLTDNISVDFKFAGQFEGFKSIINSRLYNYGDIKSYIIPRITEFCDYDDIRKWLLESNLSN